MSKHVQSWLFQRVLALVILFLFPWFFYSISITYENFLISGGKLFNNPLELLLFFILLFSIFWHGMMGMNVILEDYIHNIFVRVFFIMFINYLSFITYAILVFTILYHHIY
ncbi:MAG: succinate dehydrogenase, hydrophobic membrane anchor protein [Wolbachia endosymbiont of Fragariocoptes setiger]|nr:succinate dehydrogenase, hydrophobic membrane anchor protein [Wolbachia endosymbiont of Fragariocoptes setiger]